MQTVSAKVLGCFPIYLPIVLLISPRFVYLIAALCGLYGSIAPVLSSTHNPITFFRVGFWIGTMLLLVATVFPSTLRTNIVALIGSTCTTALLFYGVARFVAFRLGYVHGMIRIAAYHPNAFDRVNQIVTKPILFLFLISSVASLLISALLTFRLRNQTGSSPRTESTGD